MRKILSVVTIIIFVLIAIYLIPNNSNGNSTKLIVPYKTVKALKGDLIIKISAKGIVEPNFKVEVKSKASGKVLTFPFEEGDYLKKGEALLHLNKNDETRSVAKANADLKSSEASLEISKTALLLQKNRYKTNLKLSESEVEEANVNLKDSLDNKNRQSDLYKKKYTSKESIEKSITNYKVNKENLTQAIARLRASKDAIHDITMKEYEVELASAEVTRRQVALDESSERLEETDIYAPINGVIIQKLVEEGQIISSGISSVSGGTPLAEIADMSRMFIMADVDETDIGEIRVGQKVEVTADAFYGETFQGKVLRISPKGIVVNSITIFKVKVEILGDSKNLLKPMMSSNVDIITKKIKNTTYIAREAIRETDDKPNVVILTDDIPKEISITVGVQTPIYAEILSGINHDQDVIIGDWEKLLKETTELNSKGSSLKKILWMLRS
jgi:HlyD family secretion protein|tara:strand:- start:292 stop:1623 length:1332 start_codon:yes stop_codon:yes gene_type:complete